MNQIATHFAPLGEQDSVDAAAVPVPLAPFTFAPEKLARLDLGLFHQLRTLGTSMERIRAALSLSVEEYDYLCRLD